MTDAEAIGDGFVYRVSAGQVVKHARTIDEANELQKALKGYETSAVVELLEPRSETVSLVAMVLEATSNPMARRVLNAYLEGIYALRRVEHELQSIEVDENWLGAARSRTEDYVRNAVRHLRVLMAEVPK